MRDRLGGIMGSQRPASPAGPAPGGPETTAPSAERIEEAEPALDDHDAASAGLVCGRGGTPGPARGHPEAASAGDGHEGAAGLISSHTGGTDTALGHQGVTDTVTSHPGHPGAPGHERAAGPVAGFPEEGRPAFSYRGTPRGYPTAAGSAVHQETADPARIARRYLLKAAVFGAQAHPGGTRRADEPLPGSEEGPGWPSRVVTGTVLDVSPQVLVIGSEDGSVHERFTLTAGAIAWRGGRTEPAALRTGDRVVLRRHGASQEVADLIWANIGRVTGTILCRERSVLYVDAGNGRAPRAVIIPRRTSGQIQVRFPRLEPGYLIDVIGTRRDGYVEGLVPATYQPTYRVDHIPAAPLVNGHLPGTISGAAVWHEPAGEPEGLAGIAYPAVDRQTGWAGGWTRLRATAGCVSLPYLSVGSLLRVRNDCSGQSCVLPVVGRASTARLFCDRSVTCGPSPRGRIADLTVTSFVELGGELDLGSFNASIQVEV